MGVIGVQLVVSLLMASLMQKLVPHYSIGRWLLCNGSLVRFRHPSDDELRTLAGKQKPRLRRDRRQNGVTENKPEVVPKDIKLSLEATPIKPLDALVLRYFLDYQWLVDFVMYATLVYVFTEAYYSLLNVQGEVNVGVLWCLLTLVFGIKLLFSLMAHYFKTEEGGERSVCLTFAFLFLLIAMLVLVVREDYLEFGLEPGFANLYENLQVFFRQLGVDNIWPYSVARLIFKLSLVGLSSFIGACLTFPGLRMAQTHLDALKMTADKPATQVLLYANFLSPIIVLLLWVKPISRDFVINAPFGREKVQLMSDSTYNTVRLWVILGLCALRLLLTRYHLQAYLNLAEKWVELMKKEAGSIPMIEIQRKISRVFCYLCVVTVQYLGPAILIMHSTLLLKVLGDYSWGLYPEPPMVPLPIDVSPPSGAAPGEEDDYRMAVSQITAALATLRDVFTPLFYRGLFSFLTWWLAACQVVMNLFGLYFHQYLVAS